MAKTDIIILVESGATKSDWRIVDCNGTTLRQFLRPGMNVSTMKMDDIRSIIAEAFESEGLGSAGARGFFLYAAGVVTPSIREEIVAHVKTVSGITEADVQDDLMGSARAVCGHAPGIAAILGTGSNACFYDGVDIHRNVYSGGFILGDEGSAATLGKLFLADFLKGLVPAQVASDFEKEFDASYASIVQNVYRSVSPSGYLGSLAPFIVSHAGDPYVKKLVEGNFRAFIKRVLSHYDTVTYPVGIVGGFGWACRDMLEPLLEENGIRVAGFVNAPIEGLCKYHAIPR